eukprot:TRINITY_DN30954_c0_g1_i1.p1 TRINITY_DN30954_c0_g1~~TRINITY_DN30954_c0_g1_i1.p1  ORF type:complete len:357 (-),score=89.07 TRINITY_DN30954_c0_g1_i1:337-1407(-)
MPPSSPADLSWEPLSEDELKFCWQALVDNGQLSVKNLQKFMSAVAGEDLTAMQAKDLLGYLDASGDGRVGYEEFSHFMSFSELRLSDPKTFMWAPMKKFREERGINSKAKTAQSAQQEKKESDDDESGFTSTLDAWGEVMDQASAASRSPRASLKHSTPNIPVAKAGKSGSAPSSRRGPRRDKSDDIDESAPATLSAQASTTASAGAAAAKPKKLEVDPKLRAKIVTALEKHEAQTWDRLLHEQEVIRKKFFQQYSVATPGVLDSKEYHKMVQELHKLARHDMPGELKAADSVAALQSIIEQSQSLKKSDKEKGEDSTIEAAIQKNAGDLKLTYELWHHMMSGRGRFEAKAEKAGK